MKITAYEIAESFINGNISWVKGKVKSKKAFVEVMQALKEIAPMDVDNFIRICGGL